MEYGERWVQIYDDWYCLGAYWNGQYFTPEEVAEAKRFKQSLGFLQPSDISTMDWRY